ncbi:MAG: DUF2334 domain-containing protein [Hyphomicrobiaceae bacterium]
MNTDAAREDGLVVLPRFGARCVQTFFELPASTPAADVLYCENVREVTDLVYEPLAVSDEHTLLFDLSLSEDQLLSQMKSLTRRGIRQAIEQSNVKFNAYSPQDLSHRSDVLLQFMDFYDVFAKSKGLTLLRREDLLAQCRAGLIWLTNARIDGEILVWHCHVATHGRARFRYGGSHFRQKDPELRKLIGRANRWLHWQDMRMFRDMSYKIYDMGGWYAGTDDTARLSINQFKESFGGTKARLQSVAIPLSLRGRLYLKSVGTYKALKARRTAGSDAAKHTQITKRASSPSRPKCVTFIIPEMTPGGAERVMAIMANHWASLGWTVSIITIAAKTSMDYRLDHRIIRISLNLGGDARTTLTGLANNVHRAVALRRAINETRPDAVISFMVSANIVTLLATRFTGIPVIIAEHTVPEISPRGRMWHLLRRGLYPFADRLVVLTREAADFFWSSMQPRISVVPNPVRKLSRTESGATLHIRQPFILTVGRLEAVKQLDHTLRAFAAISDRFPEWQLVMVGSGSLRDSLEQLSRELGIADRVEWPGFAESPEDYMRQAELFVMSSHHEGFPCALQEAMACGLPVLSYDCPGGIREIVRDGIDGRLVRSGDVDALAEAMADLLATPQKRARFGQAALAVRERYSIDHIMNIWESELRGIRPLSAGAISSAKYLIRLDDICPTMNWDTWREIEKTLVEHDVKPVLAVVPDNRDPKLRVDEPHPDFWHQVRVWQSRGWTIGLHGYQHDYVTTTSGYIGVNRYSEFAGLSAKEQHEKIRLGIEIFRENGVKPQLWIAPAHTFDKHTLEALRAEGIDTVSDGFFPHPGWGEQGMFWVPQQLWRFRQMRRGVWTVCLHHNDWTQTHLNDFRENVKRYKDRIVSVDELRETYGRRKLSSTDRIFAKIFEMQLLARNRLKKIEPLRKAYRSLVWR